MGSRVARMGSQGSLPNAGMGQRAGPATTVAPMVRALAVVSVLLCLLGTSCTSRGASGIEGDLTYVGGPPPPPSFSPIRRPGTVRVYTMAGKLKATVAFQEGEGFRVVLPPGTYRVVGRSGAGSCPRVTAHVEPSSFAHVPLRCSVI